jgi:dCTP deaminase
LRIFKGKPEESKMDSIELYKTVFNDKDKNDNYLCVDLDNTNIANEQGSCFCASNNNDACKALDLAKRKEYDPCEYWRILKSENNRLQIKCEEFYILKSKERITVPHGIAIYARAIDETIGEMRIHYAGFVHPCFGGSEGTPLIFEVRGHNVNVLLKDEEKLATLIFYRMSQDYKGEPGEYTKQGLKLSNIFKDWPTNIKVDQDGNVTSLDNGV